MGPGWESWFALCKSRALRYRAPLPGRVHDNCRSTAQYPLHSDAHLHIDKRGDAIVFTDRRDPEFTSVPRQAIEGSSSSTTSGTA